MELRNKIDESYNTQPIVVIRHKKTLKQLYAWRYHKKMFGRALDIGDKTRLTDLIHQTFPLLTIENTSGDLDFTNGEGLSGAPFDMIFNFEVIEHLMNPLWFMLLKS